MGLFGPPDVPKLEAKRDVRGLIKALAYPKDPAVRRAAAMALGGVRPTMRITVSVWIFPSDAGVRRTHPV